MNQNAQKTVKIQRKPPPLPLPLAMALLADEIGGDDGDKLGRVALSMVPGATTETKGE